jgi:hypothetical protein
VNHFIILLIYTHPSALGGGDGRIELASLHLQLYGKKTLKKVYKKNQEKKKKKKK